jgi:hypothetical protein
VVSIQCKASARAKEKRDSGNTEMSEDETKPLKKEPLEKGASEDEEGDVCSDVSSDCSEPETLKKQIAEVKAWRSKLANLGKEDTSVSLKKEPVEADQQSDSLKKDPVEADQQSDYSDSSSATSVKEEPVEPDQQSNQATSSLQKDPVGAPAQWLAPAEAAEPPAVAPVIPHGLPIWNRMLQAAQEEEVPLVNLKLGLDWHNVIEVRGRIPQQHHDCITDLLAKGVEISILSYGGAARNQDTNAWAETLPYFKRLRRVSFTETRLKTGGKADLCRQWGIRAFIDDSKDILQEMLKTGMVIYPISTYFERHQWARDMNIRVYRDLPSAVKAYKETYNI